MIPPNTYHGTKNNDTCKHVQSFASQLSQLKFNKALTQYGGSSLYFNYPLSHVTTFLNFSRDNGLYIQVQVIGYDATPDHFCTQGVKTF